MKSSDARVRRCVKSSDARVRRRCVKSSGSEALDNDKFLFFIFISCAMFDGMIPKCSKMLKTIDSLSSLCFKICN